MDSSISPRGKIWFLRVCNHISTGLSNEWIGPKNTNNLEMIYIYSLLSGGIKQSDYRPHDYGTEIQYLAGTEMVFSSWNRPHLLWYPHILFRRYQGLFPWYKARWDVKIKHPHPSSAKVNPLALELTFNRWREQNSPTKCAPFFVLEGRMLSCTGHLNGIGLQPEQKISI